MSGKRRRHGFPSEADEATVLVLMSVVRADQRVMNEELDLVYSFFSQQLNVSARRLENIRNLVQRYAVELLPQANLQDTLDKLPPSARHILFSVALEIAVVDDDLADAERNELQRIGRAFGLSDHEIQSRLLEVVRRTEDAFSLLDVEPDSEWSQIQAAYRREKEKYSPAALSKLGVAFQSLAFDRLERIDWAYQTLGSIYHSAGSSDDDDTPREIQRKSRPKSEVWNRPIPTEEFSIESDIELWIRLPEVLAENWRESERDWDILEKRLGLTGDEAPTLDELGQKYGISRERVRQIENQGRRIVRALLLTGVCQDQSMHPRVVELCRSIFSAIQNSITAPVVRQKDFIDNLEKELGWEAYSPRGLYPIIEEWLELNHVELLEDTFVFQAHSSRDIRNFQMAAEALLKILDTHGIEAVQTVREQLHRELSHLRCPADQFFELVPGVTLHRGRLALAGFEPTSTPVPEVLEVELTTEGWDRDQIGDILEQYFSRHFLSRVSFRVLGIFLQSETGLPYRIACDVLRQHPAITRERVRGRMFASLRTGWRKEAAARREFSRPTVQELVDDFLRERVRGDIEIAMDDVVNDMAKEIVAPTGGLTEFVARSEHCRRFERGGQTWVTSVPQSLNMSIGRNQT